MHGRSRPKRDWNLNKSVLPDGYLDAAADNHTIPDLPDIPQAPASTQGVHLAGLKIKVGDVLEYGNAKETRLLYVFNISLASVDAMMFDKTTLYGYEEIDADDVESYGTDESNTFALHHDPFGKRAEVVDEK